MFNFLNSTVLFAAAAALIPLLIHLFSKRRVKIVEFSSLKHLREMQKRQVRRLKVRQLLLLLLRMLIILAVVLAFARPTTEGGNVGSHASVSAVILFDNSASMNRYVADGNLFEIARKRTERLLESFGESDEVRLLPLNQPAAFDETRRFVSAAVASEQLAELEPGHGIADLQTALGRAAELMDRASNLNKEIYVVTDRQRRSLPDSGLGQNSGAHVFLVSLPVEPVDNVGVTAVDLGGQLLMPGQEFEIVASVRNYGDRDRDDLIASLYLDGRRVAQTDVTVTSQGEEAVRFRQSVGRGGFHSGWVELSDDKFPGDNRYYFTFRIPDQFNVLVIEGDQSARYISLALVPSGDLERYWSVKRAAPDELGSVNPGDYDVIVLAGMPVLPGSYADRLKAAVRRGTALFATYNPTTDADSLNAQWSEVTGVVVDQAARTDFTRAGYYTLESAEIDHPVFAIFGFDQGELPELKFYTLPRVHTVAGATTLALFSGQRPALVETTYGDGRVLTIPAPLGPAYSDMTGHAFFVPLVSRMAEYLAADLSSYDVSLYSQPMTTRTISVSGSLSGSMALIAPDSSQYFLAPEEDKGSLLLRARPTVEPGIYHVRHLGQEIDRFAINIDPAEADLEAADMDRFAQAIGAPDYNEVPEGVDMAGLIAEFRYGKELWQVFLWIAALLLLIEMLLSRGAAPEE